MGRKNLVKYVFLNILMNLLLGYALVVLSGQYHRIQAYRTSRFIVFHRHLSLAVRTQIGKGSVLADLG